MSRRKLGGNWQSMGTAAGDLMYPNREGIRGELKKKGVNPRDHHMDNIRQIRDKQKENRIKNELSNNKPKPFRMKKFENVQSRVFNSPKLTGLRKKRKSPRIEEHVEYSPEEVTPRRRRNDPKSAIARNRRNVKDVKTRRGKKSVRKLPTKHKVGKVPKYLRERKKKWKEVEDRKKERRRRRRECPKGMVLMREEERIETVRVLNKNKEDICVMIGKLPVICDTIGLKRKKIQLEQKYEEIEKAIKLFSKDKVYIAQ